MKQKSRGKMKPHNLARNIFNWFPFSRFLQDSIYEYSVVVSFVPMDSKSVPTVKFFKDKELQKLLCEVPISKVVQRSRCSFQSNIQLSVESTSNPRLYWFYFTLLPLLVQKTRTSLSTEREVLILQELQILVFSIFTP